jgi:hypothetical protein
MHITTVYVEPQDILNNLAEEYKDKFNKCVFTDVEKAKDGTVNITCVLFNDQDEDTGSQYRYKVVLPAAPEESEKVNEVEEVKE